MFPMIMSLCGNLMGFYISLQFLNIFFEKGEQKERFIRYIAFLAFFLFNSVVSLILNWPPLVLLSTSMAGIFLMTLTYRGKWKTRIIAALLVGGLHLVLEDVFYRLLIVLHSEYIIPLILAVTDLLFFLCMIVAKKIADQKRGQEIPLSEWLAVILIPGISIFFSAIVLDQCRDEKAAFLGGLCMVFLNLAVFYLLEHLKQLQQNRLELSLLEQENRAYENQLQELSAMEDSMKSLLHDIKNHLLVLQEMAGKHDFSDMDRYVESLNDMVEQSRPFSETGNVIVDSLLNIKLKAANHRLGIEPVLELAVPSSLPIENHDLCIILGNLLDNAIEALEQCRNGYLGISMKVDAGMLFLQIVNSYTGSLKKQGERFLTSKAASQEHGIGLNNVKKIVEKYHGEMHFKTEDDLFRAEILLYL